MFKDLITAKERIQTSKEARKERMDFLFDAALIATAMLIGMTIIVTFFIVLGAKYGF